MKAIPYIATVVLLAVAFVGGCSDGSPTQPGSNPSVSAIGFSQAPHDLGPGEYFDPPIQVTLYAKDATTAGWYDCPEELWHDEDALLSAECPSVAIVRSPPDDPDGNWVTAAVGGVATFDGSTPIYRNGFHSNTGEPHRFVEDVNLNEHNWVGGTYELTATASVLGAEFDVVSEPFTKQN